MSSPSRLSALNRVLSGVPGFRPPGQRFVGLLVLLASLAPLTASAQVQSLGDLSFVVPTGWSYDRKPSAIFATIEIASGRDYCLLRIFQAIPRTQAVDEGFFAAIWAQLIGRPLHERLPDGRLGEHHSVSGYPGREMYGGQTRPVILYVLETGTHDIPVVVQASSGNVSQKLYYVVQAFLDSVRVGTVKAQPPKTTIVIADLVGEWSNDFASSVAYVNRYSDSYAGSSIIAGGSGYTIAADGRYTSVFQGINNGEILKDKSAGHIELTDGHIIFRDRDGKHYRDYRFIRSEVAPDGSTILTLMEAQYPATSASINSSSVKWRRTAPKK